MLGDQYINYDIAVELCSLQRLDQRRKQLCLDFATSLINHPMCSEWLPVKNDVGYSLRKKSKFKQYFCKTKRFQNSSIPYFITLLNA